MKLGKILRTAFVGAIVLIVSVSLAACSSESTPSPAIAAASQAAPAVPVQPTVVPPPAALAPEPTPDLPSDTSESTPSPAIAAASQAAPIQPTVVPPPAAPAPEPTPDLPFDTEELLTRIGQNMVNLQYYLVKETGVAKFSCQGLTVTLNIEAVREYQAPDNTSISVSRQTTGHSQTALKIPDDSGISPQAADAILAQLEEGLIERWEIREVGSFTYVKTYSDENPDGIWRGS